MAPCLTVMDRAGTLGPGERAAIIAPVERALEALGRRHPLDAVEVALVPTDIHDWPDHYHGGICYGPGFAVVSVNPWHQAFAERWPDEAGPLVIHEVHHALRWPHAKRPWTLGEIAVLEGLAMHAEGLFGGTPLNYGPRPTTAALHRSCVRALEERSARESETTSWFRTPDAGDGIALGCGVNYHIGAALMGAALDRLDIDPVEALPLPADTLLKAGAEALGLVA